MLFLAFAAAVAFEPRLITFSQANSRWHDITYWDDNPASAPPEWTNAFARKKSAVSVVLETKRQMDDLLVSRNYDKIS